MSALSSEQQLYADLMDEVRIRIHALRDIIAAKESWIPRLLQEFAYLQLRMLCETVALCCLIAQGEIKDRKTFRSWRPAEIIDKLSELNPDFYPRGIRIRVAPNGVNLDDYPVAQMTKEELIDLWDRSGNFLHRGSARNLIGEQGKLLNVNLDVIMTYGQKLLNLLDQHVISSADKKFHLIVSLGGGGGAPVGRAAIWVAESPATH
jgi:hypothetical protein